MQGYINFPDKGTFISEKVIEDNLEKQCGTMKSIMKALLINLKQYFQEMVRKNIGALNALVKNYLGRVGVALDNYDPSK